MKKHIFQDIIDLIRNKTVAVESFVEFENQLKNINDKETLIIGSSHIADGYIPQKNEVSFAFHSQDLYYSYNLYKLTKHSNIKNVIMSFSVFSDGYTLIKTNESKFCIPLKLIFGIPYQYEDVAKYNRLYLFEYQYKRKINKCRKNREKYVRKPYIVKNDFDLNIIKKRATSHYKNHLREISQMNYFIKILEETKAKNQNLYIVITPVTSMYRNELPPSEEIFSNMKNITKEFPHCCVLDYFNDEEFTIEDFYNGDHLNKKGAEKLTNLIRKEISIGIN